MPRTPDRTPGRRYEEKLTLTNDGLTADDPGDMVFDGTDFSLRDATGPFNPRTGGSGITEAQHEVLDTLTHWLNETNWQEMVRSGGKVVNAIHWTDSGKTTKIREVVIQRTTGKVSQIDLIQYDGTGTEKQRLTGVITRDAGKVASIQWTKTVA
jgi:hypothetical protein